MKFCTISFLLILSVGIACSSTLKIKYKSNNNSVLTVDKYVQKGTVERKVFVDVDGKLKLVSKAIYKFDREGKIHSYVITDSKNINFFKIRYAYNKKGQIVLGEILDQQKKLFDQEGKRVPLQRLYYKYDGGNNRSKPFIIEEGEGKVVEGWLPTIQKRLHQLKQDGGIPVLTQNLHNTTKHP